MGSANPAAPDLEVVVEERHLASDVALGQTAGVLRSFVAFVLRPSAKLISTWDWVAWMRVSWLLGALGVSRVEVEVCQVVVVFRGHYVALQVIFEGLGESWT